MYDHVPQPAGPHLAKELRWNCDQQSVGSQSNLQSGKPHILTLRSTYLNEQRCFRSAQKMVENATKSNQTYKLLHRDYQWNQGCLIQSSFQLSGVMSYIIPNPFSNPIQMFGACTGSNTNAQQD